MDLNILDILNRLQLWLDTFNFCLMSRMVEVQLAFQKELLQDCNNLLQSHARSPLTFQDSYTLVIHRMNWSRCQRLVRLLKVQSPQVLYAHRYQVKHFLVLNLCKLFPLNGYILSLIRFQQSKILLAIHSFFLVGAIDKIIHLLHKDPLQNSTLLSILSH